MWRVVVGALVLLATCGPEDGLSPIEDNRDALEVIEAPPPPMFPAEGIAEQFQAADACRSGFVIVVGCGSPNGMIFYVDGCEITGGAPLPPEQAEQMCGDWGI